MVLTSRRSPCPLLLEPKPGRVRRLGILEVGPDAVLDDLGVFRDAAHHDPLRGVVPRPDLEDAEDRRTVPADADGDGPALLVDLFEEQAVFPGPRHELVLSGEQQLPVRPASGGVEERLRRLEQERNGARVVADLPV